MKKLLSLLLCALLLQVFVSLDAEARKKPRKEVTEAPTLADTLFTEAMRHFLAGRYDAQYELLDECLRQRPDMPEALYFMARQKLQASALLDSATVEAGDSMLRRAYALDSTNADIRDYLIFRLMSRQRYGEATTLMETHCARRQPAYEDLGALLQLYEIQGRYNDALDILERMDQIEGPSGETAWERYQLYECTGQREKAIVTIDSLIEKALPDPATSDYLREKLLSHPRCSVILDTIQNQLEAALDSADYPKLIEVCKRGELYRPEFLTCYYYEAVSWIAQNDTLRAVEACQRGMNHVTTSSKDETAASFSAFCGDVYSAIENLEASTECYEISLQLDSTQTMVLNNYAYQLALLDRDLERAEEMSRATLKEEPDNPTYLDTYAWILYRSGRIKEARRYIDKAIRFNEGADETLAEHRRAIYQKLRKNR